MATEESGNEHRALYFLSVSSASLSLIGALIIATSYVLSRKIREQITGMRYIFFLCLADIGLAAAELIPRGSACYTQGFLVQWFSLASCLWTVAFAHALLRSIPAVSKSNDTRDPNDSITSTVDGTMTEEDTFQFPPGAVVPVPESWFGSWDLTYHALCWGLPLASAIALNETIGYGPAGPWCWVAREHSGLRLLVLYLPALLTMMVLSVLYYVIHQRTRAGLTSLVVNEKLSLYLLTFIFVWIFGVTNRLYEFIRPDTPVFFLQLLQAAINPLQGFLNALVYGFSLPIFREAVSASVPFNRRDEASHETPLLDADDNDLAMVPGLLNAAPAYGPRSLVPHQEGEAIIPFYVVVSCFAILAISRGTVPYVATQAWAEFPPLFLIGIASLLSALLFLVTIVIVKVISVRWDFQSSRGRQRALKMSTIPCDMRFLGKMLVMAVFNGNLPNVLVTFANKNIPLHLIIALLCVTPLLTLVIKRILLPSKYGTTSKSGNVLIFAGLFVGFVGALSVCFPEIFKDYQDISRSGSGRSMSESYVSGVVLSLLAGFFWACASVYNDAVLFTAPALAKSLWQQFFGGILVMFISLVWEYNFPPSPWAAKYAFFNNISATAVWESIYVTVAATFIGVFVTYFLLDTIQSVRTASVWYIVPVVTLISGLIKGSKWTSLSTGERVVQILGSIVIVVGMVMTLIPRLREWMEEKNLRQLIIYDDNYDTAEIKSYLVTEPAQPEHQLGPGSGSRRGGYGRGGDDDDDETSAYRALYGGNYE